jgi:hypothetical protein
MYRGRRPFMGRLAVRPRDVRGSANESSRWERARYRRAARRLHLSLCASERHGNGKYVGRISRQTLDSNPVAASVGSRGARRIADARIVPSNSAAAGSYRERRPGHAFGCAPRFTRWSRRFKAAVRSAKRRWPPRFRSARRGAPNFQTPRLKRAVWKSTKVWPSRPESMPVCRRTSV